MKGGVNSMKKVSFTFVGYHSDLIAEKFYEY